ncbi:cache domain-containing protein, partial [Klebsiella pneumoniae]|nr:cache domain-containing protein [Klebsiella pneumoniae]
SAAGLYSAYMMQRELVNGREAQTHALVDTARNMAIGLQKQVDAGQMTKEAAIAEFAKRAQTMTYENGTGYMFVY